MIIALSCKSESGDDYLFLNEVETVREFFNLVTESLGDELAFLWQWTLRGIGTPCDDTELGSRFGDMIEEYIEDMEDDYND